MPITSGSSNDFASTVALRPRRHDLARRALWNGNCDFCGTPGSEQGSGRDDFLRYRFQWLRAAWLGTIDDFATGVLFQTDGSSSHLRSVPERLGVPVLRRTLPCRRRARRIVVTVC